MLVILEESKFDRRFFEPAWVNQNSLLWWYPSDNEGFSEQADYVGLDGKLYLLEYSEEKEKFIKKKKILSGRFHKIGVDHKENARII